MHGNGQWGAKAQREYAKATKLLEEMDFMRKAWMNFRPAGTMKRSEVMMLGTMQHLRQKSDEPVTVGRLSRQLNQSMPAVSQKVSALEENGMLRRIPDKQDRRQMGLELTEKGREATKSIMKNFMEQLELAMEQLGEEKSDTLLQLMHEMSEALERNAPHAYGYKHKRGD